MSRWQKQKKPEEIHHAGAGNVGDAEARFLDRDVGFAKAESLGLVHEGDALADAVALWGERILQAVRDLSPDVLASMLALREQMTAVRP